MKGTAAIVALGMLTVMLAGCAGNDKDTDGDGLSDGIESRGWDVVVYGMIRSFDRHVEPDSEMVDSDGDGLSDWDEWLHGQFGGFLDPTSPDTDGDGLSDCYEWYVQVGNCPLLPGFRDYDYKSYQTDPLMMDSDFGSATFSRYQIFTINDGRGFQDFHGKNSNYNEGTQESTYTRGDGISDYDEIFGYDVTMPDGTVLEGVQTDPLRLDSDDDDLEDGEEALIYGSDPRNPNTDGDACKDGWDLFPAQDVSYGLQFSKFRLIDGPQADGGARLVLDAHMMGAYQVFPSEGHRPVAKGETVDISDLSGTALKRTDCDVEEGTQVILEGFPWYPWVQVDVAGHHKDAFAPNNNDGLEPGDLSLLDTYTASTPEGHRNSGAFYWNPQANVYRWTPPDDPFRWDSTTDDALIAVEADGLLHFQGEEGEIWLRPTLL